MIKSTVSFSPILSLLLFSDNRRAVFPPPHYAVSCLNGFDKAISIHPSIHSSHNSKVIHTKESQ